nr:DEAD/DEAH box helicase [Salinibacter ruber]
MEGPRDEKTDMRVVDEAHRARSTGSKFKKRLRETPAEKNLLMTGTPVYNHPHEISPLVNISAGENLLPETKSRFETKYVREEEEYPGGLSGLAYRVTGGTPGIKKKLETGKESLRKPLRQYVDYYEPDRDNENYPDVEEEEVSVPMSKRQKDAYRYMFKDLPMHLRWKVQSNLPPDKDERGKMMKFLNGPRQVATSINAFDEDASDLEAGQDSPKVQEIAEAVDDSSKRQVVYSNFLESGLDPLRAVLDEKGVDYGEYTGSTSQSKREEDVRRFNEGELSTLVMSSAGGEGLDLDAVNEIHVMEPHWNEQKINQVVARADRYKSHEGLPEEERQVDVKRYVSELPEKSVSNAVRSVFGGDKTMTGSVEEYIQGLAKEKQELSDQLIKLLEEEAEKRKEEAEKEAAPQSQLGLNDLSLSGIDLGDDQLSEEETGLASGVGMAGGKATDAAGKRLPESDRAKLVTEKGLNSFEEVGGMRNIDDPTRAMNQYFESGSRTLREKEFRVPISGREVSGADMMSAINNPAMRNFSDQTGLPQTAERAHYDAFEKGPIFGHAQFYGESFDDPVEDTGKRLIGARMAAQNRAASGEDYMSALDEELKKGFKYNDVPDESIRSLSEKVEKAIQESGSSGGNVAEDAQHVVQEALGVSSDTDPSDLNGREAHLQNYLGKAQKMGYDVSSVEDLKSLAPEEQSKIMKGSGGAAHDVFQELSYHRMVEGTKGSAQSYDSVLRQPLKQVQSGLESVGRGLSRSGRAGMVGAPALAGGAYLAEKEGAVDDKNEGFSGSDSIEVDEAAGAAAGALGAGSLAMRGGHIYYDEAQKNLKNDLKREVRSRARHLERSAPDAPNIEAATDLARQEGFAGEVVKGKQDAFGISDSATGSITPDSESLRIMVSEPSNRAGFLHELGHFKNFKDFDGELEGFKETKKLKSDQAGVLQDLMGKNPDSSLVREERRAWDRAQNLANSRFGNGFTPEERELRKMYLQTYEVGQEAGRLGRNAQRMNKGSIRAALGAGGVALAGGAYQHLNESAKEKTAAPDTVMSAVSKLRDQVYGNLDLDKEELRDLARRAEEEAPDQDRLKDLFGEKVRLHGSMGLGINVPDDDSDIDVTIPTGSDEEYRSKIEEVREKFTDLESSPYNRFRDGVYVMSGTVDGDDMDVVVGHGPHVDERVESFDRANEELTPEDRGRIIGEKKRLKDAYVLAKPRYKQYKREVDNELDIPRL